MSDVIVDLVESGQTLKQNGLVEIETIENISSVLIVNKTSYKVNREQINQFFKKLNLDQE
jgi:ATP phosphoribosyltransferase